MATLSYLGVDGTPFDAGYALGSFGAAAVHSHLLPSKAWGSVTQWRYSPKAAAMAALTQQRFPKVWEELHGLAAGLGVPFHDVLLWNCRGDLWAMSPDGCTTVQMPGEQARRIVHNEDGDPGFAGHCAIAECSIEGSPRFAAFVYPGSLPGHTFAVTADGLAMTVNNLRALHVDAGVPRMVLTRALLDTPSVEAAVALLRGQPRAGGFHLTLAHCTSERLVSVEFSSTTCSVRDLMVPSLHANHAIHPAMRDLPQIITGSSGHRQTRGNALLSEATVRGHAVDPLAVLGDSAHPRFPIHRCAANDDDNENTLATADILVQPTHIDWQVHEHPLAPARFRFTDARLRTTENASP